MNPKIPFYHIYIQIKKQRTPDILKAAPFSLELASVSLTESTSKTNGAAFDLYRFFVSDYYISLLLLYILETVKSYSRKDDDTFENELKVCINTKDCK
jgi:hypothetical protein